MPVRTPCIARPFIDLCCSPVWRRQQLIGHYPCHGGNAWPFTGPCTTQLSCDGRDIKANQVRKEASEVLPHTEWGTKLSLLQYCLASTPLPGAVWLTWMSPLTSFARIFTQMAPYFHQRTVSLFQKGLHCCYRCTPLGCSFAGRWALLPVQQRVGGHGSGQLLNAAPHV